MTAVKEQPKVEKIVEGPLVFARINEVAGVLAQVGIAKEHEAPEKIGGFKFRGIDDVLNALAKPLFEARLRILQKDVERTAQIVQTKNGSGMIVSVKVVYEIVAEDGSSTTVASAGDGFDTGDKATSKAISSAYKSMVFTTFVVPTMPAVDLDTESGSLEIDKQPIATPESTADPKADKKVEHSKEKPSRSLVEMLTKAVGQKGEKGAELARKVADEFGVKKFSELPKDVAAKLLNDVRAL